MTDETPETHLPADVARRVADEVVRQQPEVLAHPDRERITERLAETIQAHTTAHDAERLLQQERDEHER